MADAHNRRVITRTLKTLRLAALIVAAAIAACTQTTSRVAPEPSPITIKLIALNDFHGQLTPPGGGTRVPDPAHPEGPPLLLPTGGAAWLATLIQQLKAQNPLNAVVAAGDLIGATPLESSLFHDEPSIEALNEMGLEYSAVGNHEFDEGVTELQRMQAGGCLEGKVEETCRRGPFKGAAFRYLAANVVDRASGKPVFPASAIKAFEIGGGRPLKVGFIGAVLKGVPDIVVANGVRNVEFLDEATAINEAVPPLLAQGAEVIVLLIHEGAETTQSRFDDASCPNASGKILPIVDALDPSISVVVSGHTHRAYICRLNGRLMTSAGALGRFVTDIDLTIDRSSRKLTAASARQLAVVNDLAQNLLPAVYPTLARNQKVGELVSFYTAAVAPLTGRVVAKIKTDITRERSAAGEAALGNLIADAHLAATSAEAAGGAQIAFMNLAGIRADLFARTGNVTYGDIHAIHPFGNALITMTLTGAQIDALLERQWQGGSVLQVSKGFSYEWSASAPVGAKVDAQSIRLNGVILDPSTKYRVTANEFLAGGGDGLKVLTQGTDRKHGVLDAEALEKYVAAHSPIAAPEGGRIRKR